jgi:nitric oxide reductase NorD protein
VRALLSAPPGEPPAGIPRTSAPVESLAWAEAEARAVAGEGPGGRYRGLAPVAPWGRIVAGEEGAAALAPHLAGDPGDDAAPRPSRTARLARRPRVRPAADDEDDAKRGPWLAPGSDRQESVEDPMGLNRPTDRDASADPGGFADALAELPEARLVITPGTAREVLLAEDPPARTPHALPPAASAAADTGVAYPEWDFRSGLYRPAHVTVRLVPARLGAAAWAEAAMRRHRPLVERTRRRFERVRPRRVPLKRQFDGAEIDLDASVEAHADARTGAGPSERLYVAERPRRRDLALLVLVDASASTDRWVDGTRDIIDVEKEALLVACEGLAALGDRHALLSFSGEGPGAVHVATLKGFDEGYGATVRLRIAGLVPERYTRLGAAVRHATSALAGEQAGHRLLLVLGDGRPNDVDEYEGRYGVEDARQALLEARAQGVRPYGLAVERHAAPWLPRLFGASGFTVLRRVSDLPAALLDAVRRLAVGAG